MSEPSNFVSTFGLGSASTVVARSYVLHPGDVAMAQSGERLETLLGSCVAVILTDPRRTVAAMCHIVHSSEPPAHRPADSSYAVVAMQAMFARLRSVGISPHYCDAYVYGGGNMFPDMFPAGHVGANNTLWVKEFLNNLGVRICGESVGASVYRKVVWTVGEGEPAVESVSVRTEDASAVSALPGSSSTPNSTRGG